MQELKTEKYKGSFLLRFAVVCFALFIVISLVGQQIKIAEKREELELLQKQLDTQNIKNEELENSLKNNGGLKEYAEKQARRDLDYAKPGERIFVDVGGSD